MPLLTGSALADASGTALEDASSAALGEPDLQVAISSAGVLMEAVQMGVGPWWEMLLEILVPAIVESVLGPSGPTLDQVNANIDEVREVIDPQPGVLPNVRDEVLFLSSDHEFNIQTLKTLIEALEPGGLTTEEHDQLLGLANLSASDVWDYAIQFPRPSGWYTTVAMWQQLAYAAQSGFFQSLITGQQLPNSRWFRLAGTPDVIAGLLDDARTSEPQLVLPEDPDFADVVPGDTVLSFLLRTQPAFDWQVLSGHHYWDGGTVGFPTDSGGNLCWIICTLRDGDLETQQAASLITSEEFLPDPVPTPPVWPGSAGVTLGTPVALVDQLHLVGTMDGILVNVTTPPSKVGKRAIGGAFYDYNTGEVAFETDSGDIEPWQYLGFRDAIFTPKTMTSAAGVRLRVLAGAEGTVTPWVKS